MRIRTNGGRGLRVRARVASISWRKVLAGFFPSAAVLAAAWTVLFVGLPPDARAGHDLGKQCYVCHNIQSGQVWPGSYSVWSGKPIGMSPYGRPITCEVCHTDYGMKFDSTNRSKHPVRIIAGTTTVADNTYGTVYGASPAYMDCKDCHGGNTTVLSPDLSPDVSPLSYTLADARNASDGYPNHDNTIAGYTIVAASWDNQNVVTAGTAPHLGLTYNKVPSSNPASDYALCFSCHDGSSGKTNRRANILDNYVTGAGHYYKSGAPTGGAVNDRMACSDCHVTHDSGSSKLYRSPKGTTVTVANPSSPTASELRSFCNDCHADYGAPGSFTSATPSVRGIRPLVRPNTVGEHAGGDPTSCLASGCHATHDATAKCNACHGESSLGTGAPPYAPWTGARVWLSSVDNVSNKAGLGNHRSHVSDNVLWSGHDPFVSTTAGCAECHTSTPGSGGTHNQSGNLNATMTNIGNHNWSVSLPASFDAGSQPGATGSVVDDSCSNIDCHSPYYSTNQYKSGTPLPYRRYWLNSTLWDCYTCHGYDGRTATSRPSTGSKSDNTMSTGAHLAHVDNNALGCVRCHNVTGYAKSDSPNFGFYTTAHKNGRVNWSFAGSPNPWSAGSSYSVADNSASPSDDNTSAGHRDYGQCTNVYCHSIGQKSNGTALTGAAGEYKTPRWDNALTGRCGSCHGGDGATDNAASWIASGSHTQHVNSGPYAYGCTVCHGGFVRGGSTHADNGINLGFGGVLPGGATVTATYSQGNAHVAGNGFGNCTATYCHGTDNNVLLRLSGGANQAGSPNVPTWDNALTALCGSCHGAPGGDTNYPGKGLKWPGGAHARHLDNTDAMGPRPVLSCSDCHTAETVSTHVNGRVDFRTAYNDNTATDKSGTNVCNPCHGTGVPSAKANWDNTSYLLNCLTCHGGTAAYTLKDGTGRVAPNVAGDNAAYGAEKLGHDRPTSSGGYPGSTNPAANRSCGDCHKVSLLHINNVADNTYTGNRLSDNVNAVPGLSTISGLCAACHTNTGSMTASSNKVNSHGNTNAAFLAGTTHDPNADQFVYNCDACHEPHGLTNNGRSGSSANIFMIKPLLEVKNYSTPGTGSDNTTTVGPVYFEATSGNFSYDDNVTSAGSRLCVACHQSASRPGSGTNLANFGGAHAGLSDYSSDERRKDCASCHNHNMDDNVSTVDGLMPQRCNACHSYPGLDNATSKKQMSRGHWDHVGQPGTGGTANSKGYACTLCHYNYNHNQSGYTLDNAWSAPAYYANVNVRFDNTWNPSTPTYVGANAYSQAAPAVGGTGVCAGLYCHGDLASIRTQWNGSATQPRWDNTSYGCGTCHDTGTGDTSSGSRIGSSNHPAHLDNAWGPGVTAFTSGANGNCAEGTGCHTSYGLSPGNHPHANNLVNFRSTVADNTPAVLSTTQICVNCHTTYTSTNIPTSGDALARAQANWDNASYKLPCVTCHNGGSGTQGWQNLDGTGNRATNIEGTYYLNGHGAPGIDNASTTTDSGTVDQAVPVRCETCHYEQGQHIGTAKDGTNPWRLDNALTLFTKIGGLDNACLSQCHTGTPATHPARHAWRVSSEAGGPPSQTRDNTVHTHPTSTPVVPAGKDRWLLVPSNLEMPVLADLSTKSPPARGSASVLACVTCHDPHGVGTAQTPTRTFWGANDNGFQMLRFKSGTTPKAMCTKCHI